MRSFVICSHSLPDIDRHEVDMQHELRIKMNAELAGKPEGKTSGTSERILK
jgi:hypothetical protein